jgi:hypothetical protein
MHSLLKYSKKLKIYDLLDILLATYQNKKYENSVEDNIAYRLQ